MDKWKEIGKLLLLYLALSVMILSLMTMILKGLSITEEDPVGTVWMRVVYMVWLAGAVIGIFCIRGYKKGFADMTFTAMRERKLERGETQYVSTKEEIDHSFRMSKALLIALLGFCPSILFGLLTLLLHGTNAAGVMEMISTLTLLPYNLMFDFVIPTGNVWYWCLPLALVIPAAYVIAYAVGGKRFHTQSLHKIRIVTPEEKAG